MLTWIRRLLKRNPARYPEWRPDQILTPENRSITGDWHSRHRAWVASLEADGWEYVGLDPYGGATFRKRMPGSRP
ncbi:hypothetical protein SEA_ELEPHANTOON_38 [Mycobacterium phage Elephantoon]|nr:hypothetical protein SEA_ELEPHANTOON_38 [Mycobacterium phage Elephantoon]